MTGGKTCPAGHFCIVGSIDPEACPWGSFGAIAGQGTCELCPERFTCQIPGTVTPSPCPPGAYCAANNSSPSPCPIGTYSPSEGLAAEGECLLCAPGRYCSSVNLKPSTLNPKP